MIADFGLCKNLEEQTSNSSVCGLCAYIEPQCKNSSYKRNEKSDIYSLGVVLWEISSGRIPFHNLDKHDIWYRVCNGLRETPVNNTPSEYQKLYQECWDEDPDLRPDINRVYNTLIRLQFDVDEHEIQVNDKSEHVPQNFDSSSSLNDYSESLKLVFNSSLIRDLMQESLNQSKLS